MLPLLVNRKEDLHISSVSVATDCIATVNHLAGTFQGVPAPIIRDVQMRLQHFVDSEVIHEGREANFEVHDLAKVSVCPSSIYILRLDIFGSHGCTSICRLIPLI